MAAVNRALEAHDVQSVVLDAARLDECDYLVSGETLVLAAAEIPLSGETRGWIRRIAPPWWRTDVKAGSREAAIRGAHVALLVSVAADEAVRWLTPFHRLLWADNKLLQMRVASRLGVRTPTTAVASRARDVPQSMGDRLVLKPLGAAHFAEGDDSRVIYAQAFTRSDLADLPLAGAPFLVQSFIPPDRHLRVVTVKGRCWLAGLDASELPVDWRADEDAHHAFVPEDRPDVASTALRLAQHMGLGYSSQDWIVGGSQSWLLDVNPGGQWLFLPEPIAGDVAAAIAACLAGDSG